MKKTGIESPISERGRKAISKKIAAISCRRGRVIVVSVIASPSVDDVFTLYYDNCKAVLNGAEGQPRVDPPFNNWQQTDDAGHIIWKRRLPHPGDGPKNQKKGSDGKIEDVRWNEKQETTKRIYGEAPSAIVYDIQRIWNKQIEA